MATATADARVRRTVGFNRRFAPLARAAKNLVDQLREPKTLLYRVNAGPLPPDHWLRDPREGGGTFSGKASISSTSRGGFSADIG